MALSEGFQRRVNHAFLGLKQRLSPEKITQEQLAERVAKRLGRTLTQAAGQGWLAGSVPRDLETMAALADELGVDTNWLYFERGVAPAGWIPASTPSGLRTADERARGKTTATTTRQKKEAK